MGQVSVLVADAQRLVAEALAAALGAQRGLRSAEVVVSRAADAIDAAAAVQPDVAVVDFWIGGPPSGVEAATRIRELSPGTEVLLLSAVPGAPQVQAAMAAGAAGYLPKTISVADLADAVHRAHRGDTPVLLEKLWRMVEAINGRADQSDDVDARLATLTERELEIVRLLPEGRSAKDLAAKLFISEGTFRNYQHGILKKTGASNQQELLRLLRNGAPSVPPVDPAAAVWERPARSARSEGVTVVVADEQRLVAEAAAQALSGFPGVEVVAAYAGNGIDALHAAVRLGPQVLVYDYWMPGTTAAGVCRYLAKWAPATAVVLTAWLHGPPHVADAVAAGAAGLVSKAVATADLAETILAAAAGRPLRHAEALRRSSAPPVPLPDPGAWDVVEHLTPRELEVVQWVGQGYSFKDIARHLGISPGTVKNHLSSALNRTGSRSRLEAVEIARRAGLVREPGVPAS